MNIITVQFDENGNAEVTIPKSPTQGDNLTNRLVAQFDATITNIATVRLHAILPNGQSMSSFQFLIKDTSAEVPTFYADLTDYYTQYAGLLKLSVSAQFDGVVQGYDTVIVEDDLDALNALETKDETYAYVTRDTWAVYNWNGSAFVENELLIYDIPVDFQKEFTIYIDEAVTSTGNVSIPLDSYTQLLLMINNTANRVSNVEDSYATKAQSIIIVESLPTLTGGAYDGRYFYLTTDNNVYKIDNETAYKVSNTTYLGTFTTPQNAVNYMVTQMTTQLPSNKLYIASETSGGVMLIMKNNDGYFTVYLNNIRYKYDDAGVFEVEEEYRYNSTLDTYEFKHQDGSWQTINESWIKVKMTESVLKMQVVRIVELQGANNLASKAVLADIQPNIDYDFGITRNDISTNSFDTVIRLGKLDNIATNDWAENDTLYLSDTIPGGITNVAPAVKVIVGFVRKASSTPTATNGSIYVVFKNLPRIATQTSDGLMSSEDKVKLDNLPTGAELDAEFSNVQGEIDDLKNNPDVSDIVQTYADLVIYDTSKLTENDIVEVLIDETRNSNKTLYRWTESLGFTYIGYSINYTQAEKDKLNDLPNNGSLNLLLNDKSSIIKIANQIFDPLCLYTNVGHWTIGGATSSLGTSNKIKLTTTTSSSTINYSNFSTLNVYQKVVYGRIAFSVDSGTITNIALLVNGVTVASIDNPTAGTHYLEGVKKSTTITSMGTFGLQITGTAGAVLTMINSTVLVPSLSTIQTPYNEVDLTKDEIASWVNGISSTISGQYVNGTFNLDLRTIINNKLSKADSNYKADKATTYKLIGGSAFALLIGTSGNDGYYEIIDTTSTTYLQGSKYSLSSSGVATKIGIIYDTSIIPNLNADMLDNRHLSDMYLYRSLKILDHAVTNGEGHWGKIADITMPVANTDRIITFIVTGGYGDDYIGELFVRVRNNNSSTELSTADSYAKWHTLKETITFDNNNIVLILDGLYASIWAKTSSRNHEGISFSVLSEIDTSGNSAIGSWNLYSIANPTLTDLSTISGTKKVSTVDTLTLSSESWVIPTLLNSWVAYDTDEVSFYKDCIGRIHLRGRVAGGSNSSILLILPDGYRPSQYIELFASQNSNSNIARIGIFTDGTVRIYYDSFSTYISLGLIEFREA